MEGIVINRNNVKKNKLLKSNQKSAKKYYGKSKHKYLKGKIDKVFSFANLEFIDLAKKSSITAHKPLSVDELLSLIRNNALVGLSGEKSDIIKKIDSCINSNKKHYLIINAIECDAGLLHDYYSLHHYQKEIEEGIVALDDVLKFDGIILASKENIDFSNSRIKCIRLPNVFPMGYEKYIINEIFDEEINGYPSEDGYLVMNLQTLLELTRIINGNKFMSRLITVGNLIDGKAYIVRVNFGTSIGEIVDRVFPGFEGQLFAGGGLFYSFQRDRNFKIDESIAFIALRKDIYLDPNKCKSCGRCERLCPNHIKLKKVVKEKNANKIISVDTSKCISCGICSYSCRANIDIRKIVMENNFKNNSK